MSVFVRAPASGGASLIASPSTFLTTAAQGALVAGLSQPFGAGTAYLAVGAVPGQLALSAGTIVRGAVAPVANAEYAIKIRATSPDARREVAETLTFRALAPTPTPTPTPTPPPGNAPVPANLDFIMFGDSRWEQVFSPGYTAANGLSLTRAAQQGVGYWLLHYAQGRLRAGQVANFGIGGGTLPEAVADPRQASGGAVTAGKWFRGTISTAGGLSGSNNKGWKQAAAHPAGIVLFRLGVNETDFNLGGSAVTAGSSRFNTLAILDAMQAECDLLGVPRKVFVIISETPTGIMPDGTTTGALKAPASVNRMGFAEWLAQLDYMSGQPHARTDCIGVDIYTPMKQAGDATINKPNLLWDGLHDSIQGAKLVGKTTYDRLFAAWSNLITGNPRRFANPPLGLHGLTTHGLVYPFVNSNPGFVNTGSNGTWAGTVAAPAPVGADIPQGWVFAASGASSALTVAVTEAFGTDPDGNNVVRVTIGGDLAAASSATLTFTNALSGANLTARYPDWASRKYRGRFRYAMAPASKLIVAIAGDLVYSDAAGAARQQLARWGGGSFLSDIINDQRGNEYSDTYTSANEWFDGESDVIDLARADLVTDGIQPTTPAATALSSAISITLRNSGGVTAPAEAVFYMSICGIVDVTS